MFKGEDRSNKGYPICELKAIFFRYKQLLNHVLLSNYQMLPMINAEHMKVLGSVGSDLDYRICMTLGWKGVRYKSYVVRLKTKVVCHGLFVICWKG
ncbi:MAG: hypothetical protein CV087_22045 [Candidatus Brocadia sp. WS118]|nr:MAG: hypothetical protein CV087_22045 [Candidatus Brocadia sp. WS118]